MDALLGAYRKGRSLGRTALGELTEVTHPARTSHLLALVVSDALSESTRFAGLLRLHMARAGGLHHPAIAHVVEVGEHAGRPFIVYECAAGETLAARLAAHAPLGNDATTAIVRALAAGLDLAHQRRLAHGLLGPEWVVLDEDGRPILVGLDVLAAVEEAGSGPRVARSADLPRAVSGDRESPRSGPADDGQALGALAGSLLGLTAPDRSDVGAAGLAGVLGRQASPDPAERYPTCMAFAVAFADALAAATVAAPAAPIPVVATATAVAPLSAPTAVAGTPGASPAEVSVSRRVPALGVARVPTAAAGPASVTAPAPAADRARWPARSAGRQQRGTTEEIPVTPAMARWLRAESRFSPISWLHAIFVVVVAVLVWATLTVSFLVFGLMLFILGLTIISVVRTEIDDARRARDAIARGRVARFVGRVELERRTRGRSVEYTLRMAGIPDQTLLPGVYEALAAFASELPSDGWGAPTRSQLDGATVLLVDQLGTVFEVRDADGWLVYRHPAYAEALNAAGESTE